jgi:hypothetical protein
MYLSNPTAFHILRDFFDASPMQRRLYQPVLIVRQVCSRFRIVANELDFWCDDEFELSSFMTNVRLTARSINRKPRETAFVEALLTDAHLVHCLTKKTKWTFATPYSFYVVLERIPSIAQTVARLKFEIRGFPFQPIWPRPKSWFDEVMEKVPQSVFRITRPRPLLVWSDGGP